MSEKPRAYGGAAGPALPSGDREPDGHRAPEGAPGLDLEARSGAARPPGELRAIAGGRAPDEHGDRRHGSDRGLGVPAERLLHDWREAYERAVSYLAALDISEGEQRALATEAVVEAARGEAWHAE